MSFYPRTYEVTGPYPVMDTRPGGKFTMEGPVYWKHNPNVLAIREDLWVESGLVKLVDEGKRGCEICQENGNEKQKKAKFTEDQWIEHYEKEHLGYEPPREG